MSKSICIGIVSPWPSVKNAEYEIIERMKIAIRKLGHDWVIVDGYGVTLESSNPRFEEMTISETADFCISMHFVSPKLWEPFTYLALWNPPRYYHDSNYDEVMAHVGSYDDYLIYHSDPIKNHLLNFLRGTKKDLDGAVEFFSGGAGETFPPLETLPVGAKLFYCGINWERLSGTHGRHHQLLSMLDRAGLTKIYGPEKFEGIEPWSGFKTYQGSIPFDGISIFTKLREAGVALVLASNEHVMSEAASNRVYEAINAGVVVLSDRNPFIVKEFGDCVFYFDYGATWEETYQNIKVKFEWILENSKEALRSAGRAQEIYRDRHTLEKSIQRLIEQNESRQARFKSKFYALEQKKVTVFLPFRSQEKSFFIRQLEAVNGQAYKNIAVEIVTDEANLSLCKDLVLKHLTDKQAHIRPLQSFIPGFNLPKFSLGGFLLPSLSSAAADSFAFGLISEDELWHEGHVTTLVRVLEDNESSVVAISGSYISDGYGRKNNFGHYSFDKHMLGQVVRLKPHWIRYSALFRVGSSPRDEGFLRVLSFLDCQIQDLFLISSLKEKRPAKAIASSFVISSFFLSDNSKTRAKNILMAANYMRDYFRHDSEYYELNSLVGGGEATCNGNDMRGSIIRFIKRRVEGKRYYSFVLWFYRKFIVKVIY